MVLLDTVDLLSLISLNVVVSMDRSVIIKIGRQNENCSTCRPSLFAGLRIRSIFGRVQQIRILKPDPDPTGTHQESMQTTKFFSYQSDFFRYLNVDFSPEKIDKFI